MKGVRLSEQNQAIVGGTYPDHFFPFSESSLEEVNNKLTDIKLEKNGADLAFKIKIIVLTLQHVRESMSPYIIIAGSPQTNNESKNFINVFQDACTDACESLEDMRFLNSTVNGLPYGYVMIQ